MLTPIDIQNHSLKTAVRGYSKKDVDDFLEEIIHSYEEIYRENRELKDKISTLSEGIQYYKNMESTLQKALVLAEKTSAETQEAAKSKADALMQETEAKSDAIQREAAAEAEALRKETQAYAEVMKSKAKQELEETRNHVRKLVQSYENYRLQFKKLAESQIEMLDSEHFSIFAPELAEMLNDAPDADEAMETLDRQPINDAQVFSTLSTSDISVHDNFDDEETATDENSSEDSYSYEEMETTDSEQNYDASWDEETEQSENELEHTSDTVENNSFEETDDLNEETEEPFEETEKTSEENEEPSKETDSYQKPEESIFIEDYPKEEVLEEEYPETEETVETEHLETEHRIEDYDIDGKTSSVEPGQKVDEDSPFTFIDTE